MIQAEASKFTATMIGRLMSDIHTCSQKLGRDDKKSARIWIIRNKEKYLGLDMLSIMNEYENQISKCVEKNNLKVVK